MGTKPRSDRPAETVAEDEANASKSRVRARLLVDLVSRIESDQPGAMSKAPEAMGPAEEADLLVNS